LVWSHNVSIPHGPLATSKYNDPRTLVLGRILGLHPATSPRMDQQQHVLRHDPATSTLSLMLPIATSSPQMTPEPVSASKPPSVAETPSEDDSKILHSSQVGSSMVDPSDCGNPEPSLGFAQTMAAVLITIRPSLIWVGYGEQGPTKDRQISEPASLACLTIDSPS
jgi:hypothetical protein